MKNRQWALPALIVVVAASGCIEREGRPVNPCTQVTIADAIQVTNVDKVDLLFMVDNSNSMTEEQANLTDQFPRLVNILASGDFDQDGDGVDDGEANDVDFDPVQDLNIGVVTSDMGTGGFTVPTCTNSLFGDDGVLITTGMTTTGCMATYPSFLNFRPDGGQSAADYARDVACVATTGTGGCGFEQQLEAVLKALSPTVAQPWTAPEYAPPRFFQNSEGNADVENNNFIRDNSVLAIVLVSDEEDCSARDPELFNPNSATFGATDLNLRCYRHAAEALHPISRFVDGLLQLRTTPNLLIFAPIVGIPLDLAPPVDNPDTPIREDVVNYPPLISDDPNVRDDRMEEVIDPDNPMRLRPSCNEPGTGLAFPPIRIVRVAEALDNAGAGVTVQSICNDDLSGALISIIDQIKSALGAACLSRALNIEADGQVDCDVVAVLPPDLNCDPALGQTPKMENGVPVREEGRVVCEIAQRVPTSRVEGGQPTEPGWYYDNFTSDLMMNCAADRLQRIAFTAQPPSGAEVRLECFQSVGQGGDGVATIGTFCAPGDATNGDALCAMGTSQPGGEGARLSCDPVLRSCGVRCANDAECRTAGLIGFVCDDRALSVVKPDEFPGNNDAYNFCVNPTCGN